MDGMSLTSEYFFSNDLPGELSGKSKAIFLNPIFFKSGTG